MTANQTLGQRVAALRHQREMTQDQLAEHLGVSSQAVSKWENDLSCPDIMLLPALADLLHATVDTLLRGDTLPETRLTQEANRKAVEDLTLRLRVLLKDGNKMQVHLPYGLLQAGRPLDVAITDPTDENRSISLEGLALEQVVELVRRGVLGKLVEFTTPDNDMIEVWVE